MNGARRGPALGTTRGMLCENTGESLASSHRLRRIAASACDER